MEGGGGGGEEEELNDVVHRESHQIDEWSSAGNTLEHVTKANLVPSTSRLLFLTVEYVEDPGGNGGNSSFTTFEGETFQQLADLEQRVVSPLDPNMSCTACYSPVQYNISRPPSPYQSSHGIIVNSSSAQVHQMTHAYLNNQQTQPSATNTPVSSHSSSSGLIVMEDQFSPHHSAENYVVTSSGRIIAGYPTDNPDDPNQNKLLLNNSTEVSLMPSEMAVTGLKPSEDGRLELLLSNGTIAYGLVETDSGLVASPSSIIQVKIPREYILAAGRTDATEDEENGPLRAIYNSLKSQGLIVESSDVEELRLVSELDQNEPLLDSALLEQPALLEEQVGNIAEAMNNAVEESFNKENKGEMKGYWCEDCNKAIGTECTEHVDSIISDKPVPSRARATLPAAYLAINRLTHSETMYGVFARKTIPKRTQFGPIEGVLVKSEDITIISLEDCGASQLDLLIEMEDGEMRKLDVSNENSSNWMRFVRPASNIQQQNLVISQQGLSLFFTTTQTIYPKQELQVWYSSPYAIKRSLPLLKPEYKEEQQHWPCFECDQKFKSSGNLQKHLNVHDTKRSDEIKPKKTNHHVTRWTVQKHLAPMKKYKLGEKKKHKNPYECTICKKTFPRSYSLKRHLLLLHSGENKYHCTFCHLVFSHLFNLDRHIKKVHKKSSICNPEWIQNGRSKKENRLLCVHCKLTFTSASILNLHTLTHAADNLENESILGMYSNNIKENLKCPQCTQVFPSKRDLIEHVSKHGKKSVSRLQEKQYRCQSCFKSFATCDRLQMHTLVHGDDDSKPLQCNVCKKRFLNNSALSCHIKTHSLAKLFECPMCKATFDQVLSLKSHVHLHSKNGLFICPHCNKKFDEYSLIRKHIRAFHCDRKHKCTYCGKLFPTLDKLRMHMLRHSDHREFLCANCGKQFKRKDKLQEHMKKMHSAEREQVDCSKPVLNTLNKKVLSKIVVNASDYDRFIYKCHTCMSGFKRRGMLVNHLANRHPDITPASVPELNLPILKTTRDYYCQYCEKIYKSSSKRKAHILKNHPGAELPMSNRQKGGVPDIPGLPNPTFSQTVGSVTTNPHGCQWCHKQYASKAKLLQHQRKKHLYLLPRSQQLPRPLKNPSQDENDMEEKYMNQKTEVENKTTLARPIPVALSMNNSISLIPEYDIVTAEADFTDSGIVIDTSTLKRASKQSRPLKNPSHDENNMEEKCMNQKTDVENKTTLARPVPVALSMNNSVSMLPEYDIVTADADFTDSGIVIDTSTLKRASKGDVISADLLTQAMSELGASPSDLQALSHEQYVKLVQTSNGLVAHAVDMSDNFSTHESFYTPYTAR